MTSKVNRRRMTGVVTSDKMTKTVVVEIPRTYQHPLYKKVVHVTKRIKAHDEIGAKTGDIVELVESRPMSREKSWAVEKIVRRQGEPAAAAAQAAAVVEAPVMMEEVVTEESVSETVEAAAEDVEATSVEPTDVAGEGE
jgi:small subunit ribosomal protein S17